MAIYLGEYGRVEIRREGSEDPITSTLEPSDVNVAGRRVSVNFAQAALVTGDQIDIKRLPLGTKNLQLVSGHNEHDWRGYVHKDALGALRLYKTYAQAMTGGKDNALELVKPTENQQIQIETRSSTDRCLGQIQDFEISTTRETVDITTLSQQFRNHYKNGLISGQGRLACFWEHKLDGCEDGFESLTGYEFSAYLAHLCIRVQQGAGFRGKYFIYDGGKDEESVWYEANCIVTNVSTSVVPDQIIQSAIDFVTTGPVVLRTGYDPDYVAQENQEALLQEDEISKLIAKVND